MPVVVVAADLDRGDRGRTRASSAGRPGSALPWWATFITSTGGSRSGPVMSDSASAVSSRSKVPSRTSATTARWLGSPAGRHPGGGARRPQHLEAHPGQRDLLPGPRVEPPRAGGADRRGQAALDRRRPARAAVEQQPRRERPHHREARALVVQLRVGEHQQVQAADAGLAQAADDRAPRAARCRPGSTRRRAGSASRRPGRCRGTTRPARRARPAQGRGGARRGRRRPAAPAPPPRAAPDARAAAPERASRARRRAGRPRAGRPPPRSRRRTRPRRAAGDCTRTGSTPSGAPAAACAMSPTQAQQRRRQPGQRRGERGRHLRDRRREHAEPHDRRDQRRRRRGSRAARRATAARSGRRAAARSRSSPRP